MLQRYDIAMNLNTNRLSIKEFAVTGRKAPKTDYTDFARQRFSLIHEVFYDANAIRSAIRDGSEALIAELRSDDFFPTGSCVKLIAETVIHLLEDEALADSEVYFDDSMLFKDPSN